MKGRNLAGAVIALAAVLAGWGVATSWAPDRPVEALTARWAQPPSQFVVVNGMRVHLRDEGPRDDPEPIVLLHGTSASLHTWDGWAAALRGRRRVIRMDMPGFGLTGPTPHGDYRISAYVRFATAVMDQLGVRTAVIGGNSFGGNVAWKVAVDHPDRVSRLVLVDASGYPFNPQSIPIGFKLAHVKALQPLMRNLLPRGIIESSVRNVYGHPDRITPDLVDRYYELALREGNRSALPERLDQVPRGELWEQIKQVRQPTLILWGGQDHLIPRSAAQRFQEDIAGSQLTIFEDLGHVPHEEDPARTVAVVQSFLAR